MHSLLALSLAIINSEVCLPLQFVSPPPNQAFELLGSPRSHTQSAKDNAIVIQSKPYITNSTSSSEPAKLRRNIYIQKDYNSEENYTEPKVAQYAIDCGNDKACLEAHGLDPPTATFKPYTQEELEKLLAQYTASHGTPPKVEDEPTNKLANLYMDEEEAVINVLETNPKVKEQEKSKSATWQLLQSQKHNHPYDDHNGWVTLDPVPWAQSQIQKWEPNSKPQIPSWDSSSNQHHPPSHWDSNPYHDYSTESPWQKPSYEYKPSRPQWPRPHDFPERPSPWGGNQDIITDNKPGYFPGPPPSQRPWYDQESYSSNRPAQVFEDRPYHSHSTHPSTHPSEGEGQWVLLSSTKGYAVPQRTRGKYQRSLTFDTKAPAASMSSHRTVRLTVLPAANTTNTTVSHGGLLEVESTFQTVEEAQREHAAKMLKLNVLKPEDVKPTASSVRANSRRSGDKIQFFSALPANPDSKTAVLAAIGAGMIPASMALLLPMVLGRRKRSALLEDSAIDKHFVKLQNARKFMSYSRDKEVPF